MSKFLSIGYSLPDVVRMASSNAARAIGLHDQAGALAVGRDADITIFDVVGGKWKFTDTKDCPFTVASSVQTVRQGELFSPDQSPYPWLGPGGELPQRVIKGTFILRRRRKPSRGHLPVDDQVFLPLHLPPGDPALVLAGQTRRHGISESTDMA
jgi:hypothetical protein